MLKRIFGSKGQEVTRGWRKVNDEFHNLYSKVKKSKAIPVLLMEHHALITYRSLGA
jgi:hypothetical protein